MFGFGHPPLPVVSLSEPTNLKRVTDDRSLFKSPQLYLPVTYQIVHNSAGKQAPLANIVVNLSGARI